FASNAEKRSSVPHRTMRVPRPIGEIFIYPLVGERGFFGNPRFFLPTPFAPVRVKCRDVEAFHPLTNRMTLSLPPLLTMRSTSLANVSKAIFFSGLASWWL